MTKLVNIRQGEDKKPLVMDVSDISVIVEHAGPHSGTAETTLSFNSVKQGQLLHLETKNWELDTDDVIETINDTDTELFELPYVWGDQKEIGRYFVNPALVQSIIVSDPKQSDDESEPHVALLADVVGYGRVETYKVPVSVLDDFISKVEEHVPGMLRFESAEISTRFYGEDGFTMIDPKRVGRIFPNGYDLDITFLDGMRLDFHLDKKKTVEQGRQDYLNRLVKRIQGDSTLEELFEKVGGDLNNLSPRLHRHEEKLRRRLREDFADAIVKYAPHLTQIEGADNVYYTTLDNVSWISTHEKSLTMNFEKVASERYGERMSVYFDSEEKAQAELARLISLQNAPKPSA